MTALSPPIALEVKNLCKSYKPHFYSSRTLSLNNLSLRIHSGLCTGLLGHNGAGKTTTIKAILGLLKPDNGEIHLGGQPIDRSHRKRLGYMPEVNQIWPQLTPLEVLQTTLNLYGQPPKRHDPRMEAALKTVGIWQARHKLCRQLSKGMGRRLAWAQATIHNPDILILDEPFSGLDPLGRAKIHQLISQMRTDGKTILLCTHEIHQAMELCDHIQIIKDGECVYSSLEGQGDVFQPYYRLGLAGHELKDPEQLISTHKLPQLQAYDQQGSETYLWLASQADAHKWFTYLTSHNFCVTGLEKSLPLSPSQQTTLFASQKS